MGCAPKNFFGTLLNGVNVLRVVNEARGVNLERVLRRSGGEVGEPGAPVGWRLERSFAAQFNCRLVAKMAPNCRQ